MTTGLSFVEYPRWMDDETRMLADVARKFFVSEMAPHRERFEQQGYVDRSVWARAAELGLVCCSVPTEYGGGGGTFVYDLAILQEQARSGEGGWGNTVHSVVVAHYLLNYASDEQKSRWLPRLASAEMIAAIAMTEPDAGSDLKAIRTTARRTGGDYVINGTKTFISNGLLADFILIAAKTDPSMGGRGISLIVAETEGLSGFSRGKPQEKIGLHAQDTVELSFNDSRVPAENLLGVEGAGFPMMSAQLVRERLAIGINAVGAMETALTETIDYTKTRQVFGEPLFAKQHVKFELAELATFVRADRVFLDWGIEKYLAGELDATAAAMIKWLLTDHASQVADRCLQLHGGLGFMRTIGVGRFYADIRIQRIAGGANEIMKDLISRDL
jgi:acyl-CoA dehydrogenase